jgi:hypothetical protein
MLPLENPDDEPWNPPPFGALFRHPEIGVAMFIQEGKMELFGGLKRRSRYWKAGDAIVWLVRGPQVEPELHDGEPESVNLAGSPWERIEEPDAQTR